mgnify:CR=1 FL=1
MLELIFQGFMEWAYGLTLECWEYFSSSLLSIMSMDYAYMKSHVPVMVSIAQVLLAVGWALLIGNLVFQALKSMAVGLGFEGEDPKLLFTRTFVFAFLLMASPQICEVGLSLTARIIELLEIPDAIDVTLVDEGAFGSLNAAWLLVIIFGLIIMFKVFRLLLEIAERYVILAVLTMTAPLAFAMGGSKSTSEIFGGWCRMFGSMCTLMVTNVIFFKMLLSVLSNVPSGLDIIPWIVLVLTIVKVARKADAIITRIGLNPAITGDSLGRGFPGTLTYMVMRSATSHISVLHDEAGADTGDVPAELPEGDLSAEETAEQSETLSAMEAAETKPLGLSTEEKTASQDESDTAEERVEEAELHEEMSEIPDAEENLLSDLPTSVSQASEADEADWGFGEPVPEEAAAEPAEDEYLAADNAETLDASDEKSERTLFYELDFNELDRGLSEEERKEWNSIYASFRGRSAITGTIIGVDLYARYLPRSEARMLENKRELCAVVVPYRIPILIRESEMWELGEERPDFVLRNMVGASIDVIVTKVERTANRAQASRRQASRSQRRFFAAREDLHAVGSRITCRMLAVGPRRCLVDCYGYDLDMTQREIRYAAIPDLRTEFHPGSEIDCIVKEYHPRTGELIVSAKETEVNPFFGAEERHPVGSRRFAMISGKYGGGVFCNLPDGVTCMCNYSYQHEDADFMVGEHVMLMVQRYDQEKLQMYGKIMSKW